MRSLSFLHLFLFLSGCSTGYYLRDGFKESTGDVDESKLEYRILLIGDAGEPSLDEREPILKAMEERAALLPGKTTNIFLGDNVYPFGLEQKDDINYDLYRRRLEEQIQVIKNSDTKGIFIPGNHDWGAGSRDGWNRVINEGEYIDQYNPQVQILPKDGCPGPEYKDFGDVLRIIFLNTQWWLQDGSKPDSSNSSCYPVTEDGMINSIDSLVKTAGNKFIIIAGHHPLNSYGEHGGYFDWKAHIFPLRELDKFLWIPLPVVGSLYPLLRMAGISSQDLSNSLYKDFISRMEKLISKYHKIIYVSGHEHTLQVLNGVNDNIYLISGFGTSVHYNEVSYGEKSILSVLSPGFMQLDFLSNGRIRLGVFTVAENETPDEVFSMWLFEEK
jgi:hypothetical protein